MHRSVEAIIVSILPHGEHGAVVRLLTPTDGLVAAYVRGARSTRLRPVLMPGNLVQATLAQRAPAQLGSATVELLHSRAALLGERIPAAALEWLSGLLTAVLPDHQPYPRIYAALAGLLDALENAPRAQYWAPALVRFELLLLAELGFGLDLTSCAATGTSVDLVYVSPKSARAVSREAGAPHAARLLALPAFITGGRREADWADVIAGLKLTGHFLERDLLHGRRADNVLLARERLISRMRVLVTDSPVQ